MRTRSSATATILLAAALALVACASRQTALEDLPAQDLSGHYTSGQGQSWFRRCGAPSADPAWWVTATGQAVGQLDQARSAGQLQPGARYFVRWRAAVTTGGEIGPQGPGVPALLVRELLELRPAAASDCTTQP